MRVAVEKGLAAPGSTWVQYSCGHNKIFVIYKTGFYNQNNRNGVG